jgi:methionyl-tRNA formyltransferase
MAQFITRTYSDVNEKPSIVFFGMGPVSLASLKQLHASFQIEAIITKVATNKKDTENVSDWARHNSIPCFEVHNSEELIDVFNDNGFVSQLGLVIDFGLIIPEDIIDSFRLGILNSHFSILPQWRGADPITFALLSGQEETGVSIMKIKPGLDTGDILAVSSVPIAADETNPSLTKKLVKSSYDLLINVVPAYISGKQRTCVPQDEKKATYSRKLLKSDGEINWNKEATQLEREIRAYYPWPGSYTQIDGERVVISKATVSKQTQPSKKTGVFFLTDTKELAVTCGNKTALIIQEIKPAGKSTMTTKAYLAGRQAFAQSL